MGYIIFWLTLSLLLALAIGWLSDIAINANNTDGTSIVAIMFILLAIFVLTISISYLSLYTQEYYETKEYSVTEYSLNRKIITSEKNNAVKTDTTYSFARKNKKK